MNKKFLFIAIVVVFLKLIITALKRHNKVLKYLEKEVEINRKLINSLTNSLERQGIHTEFYGSFKDDEYELRRQKNKKRRLF
jgi:hypothetical protein